jgi:hypothetical protein
MKVKYLLHIIIRIASAYSSLVIAPKHHGGAGRELGSPVATVEGAMATPAATPATLA